MAATIKVPVLLTAQENGDGDLQAWAGGGGTSWQRQKVTFLLLGGSLVRLILVRLRV